MALKLAKHLVERGLVAPGSMDDALQRQVLFGGSLDTNLLELGSLDEKTLTESLSEIYRLPMASTRLLDQRDQRMPKLFPPRLAEKYQVVPIMVSGRSAMFLASSRINPLVIEEIGFMLSLSVKLHLICEARLQGFLRDWMGLEIEPRYEVLLERMGSFDLKIADAPRISPESPAAQEDLAAADTAPALARATRLRVDRKKVEKVLDVAEASRRQEQLQRERARTGSISLEEATQACMQAEERDQIVDTCLRFARQFIPFAGLFIYNNDFILGWDAVGTPDARECIRRIKISSGVASVLGTVLQTRAYYLGPMADSVGNGKLLQAMKRGRPRNALVVPILLKERLVGMLYGDAGPNTIRGSRLVELLVFVSRLSSAFEQLILRKKAEARSPKPLPPASEPNAVRMAERAALRVSSEAPLPAAPASGFAAESRPPSGGRATLPTEPSPVAPARAAPLPPFLVPPPQLPPEEITAAEEEEPLVVDDGFLESGQILPVVDAAALQIPAAEAPPSVDALHPDEERVRIEDLIGAEDGTISVVDDQSEVVVVDTQTEFVPPPAEPPVEAPVEAPVKAPLEIEPVELEPEEIKKVPREPAPVEPAPGEEIPQAERLKVLVDDLVCAKAETETSACMTLMIVSAEAVPAVMQRFPGRLVLDIGSAHDSIPPLGEHSELLRFLTSVGADAGPAVAERIEDPDPLVRTYAVLFFDEVYCPWVVPRLVRRLYDRDARIRMWAIEALQKYRKTAAFDQMLSDLRGKLRSDNPNQRAIAAALLGNFKDREALPLLATLVRSPERMVSRAAVESLSYITKQDFGTSERKWIKWWNLHKGERRIQWLICGLRSKNRDIRFSSALELNQITGEYCGYYFDSEKEEREQGVRRWEEWWEKKGRRMHFND